MKKATLKDIKEGNFLYMQNEPDLKSYFYPWGIIEKHDIPRLKRAIRRGTCLWWVKEKTRTTAARLDRFKKADHWSQWRVEEGFAVNAECVAANNVLLEIETLTISINNSIQELFDNAPVKIPNNDNFLDGEAILDVLTGGNGNALDKIASFPSLDRLHWKEKPEIESWKFQYDPTWLEDEQLGNLWHLMWNYEETDAGLASRIKEQLGDPVVLPGDIREVDIEIKFDFPESTKTPWQRFKAIDWRRSSGYTCSST